MGDALYVADSGAHTIRRVSLASTDLATVTTIAGQAGITGGADGVGAAATFNGPQGIAVVGDKLYVGDMLNGTIREIDPETFAVTTIMGKSGERFAVDGIGEDARMIMPVHLTTDGQDLFVADGATMVLKRFRLATKELTTFAGAFGQQAAYAHPELGDRPLQTRSTWYYFGGLGFYGIGGPALPVRLH
jgi:DNA-binding beta-propeller fold protein YncE